MAHPFLHHPSLPRSLRSPHSSVRMGFEFNLLNVSIDLTMCMCWSALDLWASGARSGMPRMSSWTICKQCRNFCPRDTSLSWEVEPDSLVAPPPPPTHTHTHPSPLSLHLGLSLRHFQPDRVVLTDVPSVVPLLRANILLNQLLSHPTSAWTGLPSPLYDAVTHLWGTEIDPQITALSPHSSSQQPAIIIASDVVYDPAGFEPLLKTIQSLLLAPLESLGKPFADRVILAHRHRNPEDHQFFAMVSSPESGLSLVEINLDHIFAKYHEGDVSLRDVKIFHITVA
jgi:hypothetical protein